jgi:hypothetical protein
MTVPYISYINFITSTVEIKDTNKYDRLKYLVLTVFLNGLLLEFIKLRILKKKN